MTKYFDWGRVKDMDSRQKSEINTASTFAEQRKKKETHRYNKEFGIKQMDEEVNIDWGKAQGVYEDPMSALAKLAAAEKKADDMKDDTAEREALKDDEE
jgi:hypothetical protein